MVAVSFARRIQKLQQVLPIRVHLQISGIFMNLQLDLLACKNAAPFILILRIIPVFVLLVSDFLSVL